MRSSRHRLALLALVVLCGIATSACSSTWVVVPQPEGRYLPTDTLYGIHRGDEVRITFHYDTILRVDTVLRVDTAWVRGARTIVRVDTVRTVVRDTVVRRETILRVDTVRVPARPGFTRVDTVIRVDTVRVPGRPGLTRVDTVLRVDTVRVTNTVVRRDTVLRVDTVRVVVTDTVMRTVPGRRMLFVPPGHYPPEGQCRVWIHDKPPGQQARPAACNALGTIPQGAFILFGGEAWDFDYDWLTEVNARPGTVPPEIVALKRRR